MSAQSKTPTGKIPRNPEMKLLDQGMCRVKNVILKFNNVIVEGREFFFSALSFILLKGPQSMTAF